MSVNDVYHMDLGMSVAGDQRFSGPEKLGAQE